MNSLASSRTQPRPSLRSRWVVMFFALGLVLTGCSGEVDSDDSADLQAGNDDAAEEEVTTEGDESVSSPPSQATENDGEPTLIRIVSAGLDTMLYLPLTYAIGADLFAEEGLELDPFEALGGGAVARAVLGGSVDFAPMSFQAVVNSRVEGGDLVGFSLLNRFTGGQLLAHVDVADEIESFSDLEGRTIGLAGLGGGTHDLALQMLAIAGIDEADVTWEEVGLGATAVAALEQGTVEAIVTYDPAGTIAVREGLAVVVWDGRTEEGHLEIYDAEYPFVTMAANESTLDQRPEIAEAFARAIAQAQADIQELSAEEIWEIVPEQYRGTDDAEVYVEMLENSRELFAPRGHFSDGSAAYAVEVIGQYNERVAEADLDPEQLYTNDFVPQD